MTLESFLCKYSLETGGLVIGYFVLVSSLMAFYANSFLLIEATFTTLDSLSGYLKDTIFEGVSKEGELITENIN